MTGNCHVRFLEGPGPANGPRPTRSYKMENKKTGGWKYRVFLILISPIIIVVTVVILPPLFIVNVLWSIALNILIWLIWNTRGRRMLFVYSNSPNWQEHIENDILPRLPANTFILNWSERRTWRRLRLHTIVFRHFGGEEDFNPMAIVFRPLRRTRVFRFLDAFKEFKHGKPEALLTLEAEMFKVIGQ